MSRRKQEKMPHFNFATVADREMKLLWPDRVELFWKLDDSVSFALPEGSSICEGDELWLTSGASETLVRVVSIEPHQPGKRWIEAMPADPYSFLYFRE